MIRPTAVVRLDWTRLLAGLLTIALALGAAAFSDTADARKKLPEETPEGLKLVPRTKVSQSICAMASPSAATRSSPSSIAT
ncbi:hypothetical protein [Povalibacter sp.]|uniref:hypothetical protein n=1 Tax=Povalibacter sp. TaxID=1962978 RepID=UPI002F422B49